MCDDEVAALVVDNGAFIGILEYWIFRKQFGLLCKGFTAAGDEAGESVVVMNSETSVKRKKKIWNKKGQTNSSTSKKKK